MNDSTKSLTARRVVLSGFFFLTGICFASWASRIPDIKMQLGSAYKIDDENESLKKSHWKTLGALSIIIIIIVVMLMEVIEF